MARVLTAEDVVRRIAAECAFVDERGGVGIRLEAAAAIVRQYGEQFRRGSTQAKNAETAAAAVKVPPPPSSPRRHKGSYGALFSGEARRMVPTKTDLTAPGPVH